MGPKGMSKSFKHQDILKLFQPVQPRTVAQPVLVLPETSKENSQEIADRDSYRRSNQSLVTKNAASKVELALAQKKINELRSENEALRIKIRVLEEGTDEERIDLLVAERFQKKLAQLACITDRTVQYLSKSAADFKTVFQNMAESVPSQPISTSTHFEKKVSKPRPKSLSVASTPTLSKVDESPLMRSTVRRRFASVPDSATSIADPDATPKVTVKSRRSGFVQPISSLPSENDVPAPFRHHPHPQATPRRASAQHHDNDVSMSESFVLETDTVRRKRSAASKIGSMAEPSLNAKLRRPGKFDEPTPFVSSTY